MDRSSRNLRTAAAVGIAALGFALPTFALAEKGADDPAGTTGTTGTSTTTGTTGTTGTTTATGTTTTTGTTGTTETTTTTTTGTSTGAAGSTSPATITSRARAIAAARARVGQGAKLVRVERSASGTWKVRLRRAGVRYDVRVSRTFKVIEVRRKVERLTSS